ncbi:MAG: hypothetical protein MZV64_62535 [Ignavibacteriales bacterium]|nr:hypothetical protein [Ignavibacteriales bacterium]
MCQTVGLEPKRPQHAHAADAEQDFLHDAAVKVRPIQAGCQQAVGVCVAFHVRIEQIQGDAPHAHFPNVQGDLPVREFNLNGDRLAILQDQESPAGRRRSTDCSGLPASRLH